MVLMSKVLGAWSVELEIWGWLGCRQDDMQNKPRTGRRKLKEILVVFLRQFRPLSALPECAVISGGLYAKKRQLVRLTYLGRCDLCYNCSLCDYFEG